MNRNDEIGILIDSFNEMLSEIDIQNKALIHFLGLLKSQREPDVKKLCTKHLQ